eukprot:scaffold52379_cov60-Phaeocystis_antarctica.AAC.3
MRPERLIGRGWPTLRGSLRRDLALEAAPGEPAGRSLSHRVFTTGARVGRAQGALLRGGVAAHQAEP